MTLAASAACAQESPDQPPTQEDAPEPQEGRLVLDILSPPPETRDPLAEQECEREQDAARIMGQIVVCRRINDGSAVSGYDEADRERRQAERTQGPRTPDVEGAGGSIIYRTEGSVFMVTTGKITAGTAPEPTLIIDIEALPEAAGGSDADRIARGLPPVEPE
ncbi:MAG: hypothetical protein WBA51_00305 [Erythrobacter sp.]